MAGDFSPPASQQPIPGLPSGFDAFIFDGFEGLNTRASRPGIQEQEMYWCDNFMPIGKNNLRTLWDAGAPIFATPDGQQIVNFFFFNSGQGTLGNSNYQAYMVAFTSYNAGSGGGVYQLNLNTNAVTTIAPAGTITTAAPAAPPGVAQWSNQYLLFCSSQTNGYWVWNAQQSTLHTAGTIGPQVVVTNGGLGYTSAPTVSVSGGSGSGIALTAQVSNGAVTSVVITSAGSGYKVGDQITINFTGGGSGASTAILTPVMSGGKITSVTVVNGGTGYTQAPTITVLGGGNYSTAATLTPVAAGGAVTSVTVTNGGNGYTLTPVLQVTGGGSPCATATTSLMPFGISGSSVEIYSSHVWVANGANIYLSAPGSVSDFGTPDGGGAFQSSDSFLKQQYVSLKQSSGFLYTIADSSVNYISGVQTSGTPATTTFTNQNVDPQLGTPWASSTQVYSRAIVFANALGIHAIYGGAVEKVSGPLDGILQNTTVPATFLPSAAVATVFDIHVYMLLFPITDQITGLPRNALLMWDGHRWWTASQYLSGTSGGVPGNTGLTVAAGNALTFVTYREYSSVMTAYGTDGNLVYPLFQAASTNITKTVRSKLWDKPSYMMTKHAVRLYVLLQNTTITQPAILTTLIENERGTSQTLSNFIPNAVAWASGIVGATTWTATSGTAYWLIAGVPVGYEPLDTAGVLLGLTVQSSSSDFTVVSLTTIYQQYQLTI